MTEIIVRQATKPDVEAILALWHEMMELHRELEPLAWTIAADAEETSRAYFRSCIDDPERQLLVAVRGTEVVGYLLAARSQRPPVIDVQTVGAIYDCCVTPTARRKGIGRLLVAKAKEWFRQQGLEIVLLNYALHNPPAEAFWQAQGFRPYQVGALCQVAPETAPRDSE